MSYKKIVFCIVLIFFTSHVSSAQGLSDDISKNLYVGVQYKPARHHLSSLIIKETSSNIVATFALKKDASGSDVLKTNTNFNVKYDPHYKNNNSGLAGILGYHYNNNFRIESEVSYETFNLKTDGYKIAGFEKHIALARQLDNNNHPTANQYVTVINNGIGITSVLINACYDSININQTNMTIYSCIGFGADVVDFLSKYNTKLSYQGKAGISYPLSSKIMLFAEGYYHGLLGKKFNGIPVNYPCDNYTPSITGKTTALAMLNIRYYGGSIGVRFIL